MATSATLSLFIEDLVVHLKSNGWKIITADKAYTDKISNQDPNIAYGQGRISRIAKASNYNGELRHYLEREDNWNGLLERLGVISKMK